MAAASLGGAKALAIGAMALPTSRAAQLELLRPLPSPRPTQAATGASSRAAPGVALLERGDAAAVVAAQPPPPLYPPSAQEEATLAHEFALYREATQSLERLASLQDQLVRTVTSLDSLLQPSQVSQVPGAWEPDAEPVPQSRTRRTKQQKQKQPEQQQPQQQEFTTASEEPALQGMPSLLVPSTHADGQRSRRASRAADRVRQAASGPPAAAAASNGASKDATSQFFKMAAGTKLLTPEQQMEVAVVVKEYLGLKSIEAELAGVLKRAPTPTELARALKTDPHTLRARLQRGQEAKAMMLKANHRLVVQVVKPYQNRGLGLQDLITEGMHGLVKAVEKFEPDKGFRFSTYAHWWIRQAVVRAVQQQGRAVRLPTHVCEAVARVTVARSQLQEQLARAPTAAELAQVLKMRVSKVEEALAASRPNASLEVSAVGGEDEPGAAEAKDQVADDRAHPDEVAEVDQLAHSLEGMLDQVLTRREADIVRLHLGLGGGREQTLADLGARYGVSRERIRQVEAAAVRKLRAACAGEAAGPLAQAAGLMGELGGAPAQGAGGRGAGRVARASRGTKKT